MIVPCDVSFRYHEIRKKGFGCDPFSAQLKCLDQVIQLAHEEIEGVLEGYLRPVASLCLHVVNFEPVCCKLWHHSEVIPFQHAFQYHVKIIFAAIVRHRY